MDIGNDCMVCVSRGNPCRGKFVPNHAESRIEVTIDDASSHCITQTTPWIIVSVHPPHCRGDALILRDDAFVPTTGAAPTIATCRIIIVNARTARDWFEVGIIPSPP